MSSGLSIDWPRVHQRLARAEEALQGGTAVGSERAQALLRERALAIAAEVEEGGPVEAPRVLLAFSTPGGRFAVDLHSASEVLPVTSLTPVPRAPPAVAGLMSRRGQVLMVVAVSRALGLAEPGVIDQPRVVVVGRRGQEVGLLAISVDGIREVLPSALAPPLEPTPGVEALCDGELVVLDVPALVAGLGLSSPRTPLSAPESSPPAVPRRKSP